MTTLLQACESKHATTLQKSCAEVIRNADRVRRIGDLPYSTAMIETLAHEMGALVGALNTMVTINKAMKERLHEEKQ